MKEKVVYGKNWGVNDHSLDAWRGVTLFHMWFLQITPYGVEGFSCFYIIESFKMQKIQEFSRIFAMAMRAQLNAALAPLNKKWRMDDFFTISTLSKRRMFLKNHSIEFHKIWQGDTSDSGWVKRLTNFLNLTEEILNNPVVLQQRRAGNPSVKILLVLSYVHYNKFVSGRWWKNLSS